MNNKYYCEQVLQPFLDNDVPRLFPDDPESMVFHQDSASSHTARKTFQFLKSNNVNLLTKKNGCQSLQKPPRWISVYGEFSSAIYKSGMLTLCSVLNEL